MEERRDKCIECGGRDGFHYSTCTYEGVNTNAYRPFGGYHKNYDPKKSIIAHVIVTIGLLIFSILLAIAGLL